ncbi:MAG: hypothetical protein IT539_12140 [Bradyrhizobiaceae bacterium]|nr:hypothetical protein [Bradyrhizobiaceae bacterium]
MRAELNTQAGPRRGAISASLDRMIHFLSEVRPATDAEALRLLRGAFPDSNLSARIAAVAHRDD